jgi:hypothetical protein
LQGDDDAAFLFEPLADAGQALPIGDGSSDLRPKNANLAGFGGRLFPRLCARRSRVSLNPYCSAFVYSSLFAYSLDTLRRLSTYIHKIRQLALVSTRIDGFQQRTPLLTGLEITAQAKNTGSGT